MEDLIELDSGLVIEAVAVLFNGSIYKARQYGTCFHCAFYKEKVCDGPPGINGRPPMWSLCAALRGDDVEISWVKEGR
jgi:hypothetical protein